MDTILSVLDKYQSLILIALGMMILFVLVLRTKNKKKPVADASLHSDVKDFIKKHGDNKNSVSVSIVNTDGVKKYVVNGVEYSSLNEIEDHELRDKAKQTLKKLEKMNLDSFK
jgi:hypothetical protein